ncbi:polysaccharide deacetylase family protein [Tenacibaculum sp. SG-28]|uniref:polysaccharide deacetylase family protein n=1 Tax=Tenacibaculum sp. SG-28 TaxID=754426 RepID=UPI002685695F
MEKTFKNTQIFCKIVSEKHHIGNHTFNHLHAQKVSKATYIANVYKAEKTIHDHCKQVTNTEKLFRPPYGIIKTSYAKELREKGYTIVMWDVISGDFDPRVSPEKCLRNVQQNTRKGSVVVFHDSIKAKQNLYHTLPKVLEAYKREGYSFEGLGARNTAALNQ